MKKLFRSAFVACFCVIAPAAMAAELKGTDLVAALNGNTFDCSYSGGSMVWSFSKSDPAGKSFPYTLTRNGSTTQAGYTLHKSGKMRHSKTNASRKIVQNKNGSLTVSGSSVPKTTCVKQ